MNTALRCKVQIVDSLLEVLRGRSVRDLLRASVLAVVMFAWTHVVDAVENYGSKSSVVGALVPNRPYRSLVDTERTISLDTYTPT